MESSGIERNVFSKQVYAAPSSSLAQVQAAQTSMEGCKSAIQCQNDLITLWSSSAGRDQSCTSLFASLAPRLPAGCDVSTVCGSLNKTQVWTTNELDT